MDFKLHHIGINTTSLKLFESFWCNILGFELITESKHIDDKRIKLLFGFDSNCTMKRYKKNSILLEVHFFNNTDLVSQNFNRYGFNHIALHVQNKEQFLKDYPQIKDIYRYNNPEGWTNILFRDFEGNWIELYESN